MVHAGGSELIVGVKRVSPRTGLVVDQTLYQEHITPRPH